MRFGTVLDLLFPRHCLGCGKNAGQAAALCAGCAAKVRRNHTLFCGKCRARLPSVASAKEGIPSARRICHYDFPYVLGAACEYDSPPIKNLVHALKFRYMKDAAVPLAGILASYASKLGLRIDGYAVIPLPLSPQRLRQRGFNQSGIIASIFAGRFGAPLEENLLMRVRHAKPQSETRSIFERRENIKGCFAVKNPASVAGRDIVLIDDVTTSGATMLEAAAALKAAGAKKILALAVAKA